MGRHSERLELNRLLDQRTPLVTLVGPPGIGKTRLAAKCVDDHQRFPGVDAILCDLREVHTINHLCFALARSLEVHLEGAGDADHLVGAIAAVLRTRGGCIVLLDNFEGVAPVGSEAVSHWLRAAPEVHFLLTSRVPLRMRGERVFELGPLAIDANASAGADARGEAVQLFVDRAQAVEPAFSYETETADDIRNLCEKLEGIPLAIELAASRMDREAPGRLAEQLDQQLLSMGAPVQNVEPTHRTLRAAIDVSWRLLTDVERSALAQLSVFRGGFTGDAAEAVVDVADFPDAPAVLAVVARLRAQSLLRAPSCSPPRWDMFEALREYASEKLDTQTKAATAVKARHAVHFLRFGEETVRETQTPRAVSAYASLLAEYENLRASAVYAARAGADDWVNAARIALVIHHAMKRRSPSVSADVLTQCLDRLPPLTKWKSSPLGACWLGRRRYGMAASWKRRRPTSRRFAASARWTRV